MFIHFLVIKNMRKMITLSQNICLFYPTNSPKLRYIKTYIKFTEIGIFKSLFLNHHPAAAVLLP